MSEQHEEFNFEYWKELYQKDPIEFVKQRDEALAECASSIPDEDRRRRMLASVHNVNMRLDRIKSPIERFNQLQVGFWNQTQKFKESLDTHEEIREKLKLIITELNEPTE